MKPEVITVSTLYTQAINPRNAVHYLWTPAQHYRGITFVVCPDANLRPLVTQITRKGEITSAFLDTGTDPVYTAFPDGHFRFTMGIDKNGYLHIIGDMHGYSPWDGNYIARYQRQTIMYWKSNKVLDVRGGFTYCGGLNSATRLPGVEFGGDSRFINDRNGELYYTSRVRAFKGSNLNGSEPFIAYGLYRYNTTNGVWTALGGTVDPEDAPGAYEFNTVLYWEHTDAFEAYQTTPVFDSNNRLHFAISGKTAGVNCALIYAYSDDGGNVWKKADGTVIPGLPLRGKDGEANQGDLVTRADRLSGGVCVDKDGKVAVAAGAYKYWSWSGTSWTNIQQSGGGILGPDSMITGEAGPVVLRSAAVGQPATAYENGYRTVFSMSELGVFTENAVYAIGILEGGYDDATNMSVVRISFTPSDNIATGGTASAHSGGAYAAFDGDNNAKWYAEGKNIGWLQYDLGPGRSKIVCQYNLVSGNDMPGRDPKDWEFQGSADGKEWITLDKRTGETFSERIQMRQFTVAKPAAYQFYRLNITANSGRNEIQLGEMELIGKWKPYAPKIFYAKGDDTRIWLSWTASACATGYNVKRASVSGGPYKTIASGVTNTGDYVDTGLVNGKTYYYVVSAVGELGESDNSVQVSAKPMDQPLAPIIQEIIGGNREVTLSWVPLWPKGAKYNIKRASAIEGPYKLIGKGFVGLRCTDTGLADGVTNYYAVSAVSADGTESPDSVPVAGTPFRWVPVLKYASIGYDPSIQGFASASKDNPPREGAAAAFDGNFGSRWLAVASSCWLQYQFTNGAAWAVTRYTMVSGTDVPERNPTDWQFMGSNDGNDWTTLDTQSAQKFTAGIPNSYIIDNKKTYQYYRLNITDNIGHGITQLSELVLWADGHIRSLRKNQGRK